MTQFPVGGLQKLEVRAAAARHGLAVADKPESADICFVPGGDYRAVGASASPTAKDWCWTWRDAKSDATPASSTTPSVSARDWAIWA